VVGAAALVIPKLALDAELYVGGQSAWDRERGIQREAEAPLDPADWIGAYVHAWARPFAPSPQAHPWAFHAREFQRRRGVAAAFRVNSVDLLTALEPPHPFTRSLHRVLESVRRHLRATAAALLSPEVAALVTAVVMGERGALPDAINEHFRTAGLTHLLVVSGLHTGFMLGAALVLARFARLPPRLVGDRRTYLADWLHRPRGVPTTRRSGLGDGRLRAGRVVDRPTGLDARGPGRGRVRHTPGRSPEHPPRRLAALLCMRAGVDGSGPAHHRSPSMRRFGSRKTPTRLEAASQTPSFGSFDSSYCPSVRCSPS
jgi:hypothetical protein